MINVFGFANDKQVYRSRIPGIVVPHEGSEVRANGKWWRVVRKTWESSSDVRLELESSELGADVK